MRVTGQGVGVSVSGEHARGRGRGRGRAAIENEKRKRLTGSVYNRAVIHLHEKETSREQREEDEVVETAGAELRLMQDKKNSGEVVETLADDVRRERERASGRAGGATRSGAGRGGRIRPKDGY